MKADFWFAILWFISAISIMIYFLEKVKKTTGRRDWRTVDQNFTEEQRKNIGKHLRKMRLYLLALFLLFVTVGLIFLRPK